MDMNKCRMCTVPFRYIPNRESCSIPGTGSTPDYSCMRKVWTLFPDQSSDKSSPPSSLVI